MFINLFANKYLGRQILLSSIGLVQGACAGGIFAFTSVLFAQLKHDHTIQLDTDNESWLASIPTILMFPSCLLSGVTMEAVGRKRTIFLSEILALSSWLLTYFATDYAMLLGARILIGIFLGIVYPTFITYLGEVSEPKYRTIFLTAIPIGSTFGAFICQFLGEYVQWKIVALIFFFFPLYDLLLLFFIKDSYVTCLDKNNLENARACYEWFRGDALDAKREFDDILVERKTKQKESFMQLLHMCANRAFLIPLSITTLVFLTNEFTGTQAVIFYTSQIINMIKDDPEFVYYATLVLNILRIVAVILSLLLVKITSVRFILLSSGYMLGLSLLLLALFMYLSMLYSSNTVFPIISLCALVMNTVLYGIGLGPLPSVVCGEMFPQATRGIGGSISAACSFLFLFIVVKFMPMLFSTIGSYWTFFIFGIFTLIGIAASHFFLPNTKNKTLQEINKLYQDNVN
ncbi:facilitated trehalose transporter Tret1-like isoform X1 [Atheta coriaria]|uniref:facilitated trehalose transporter Tret1-like isoform X1 n=1 Tax=Dalotia coriaria TaxID=877792 RepID=UPI0031F455FF